MKNKFEYIFFGLITFLLIFVWFSDGKQIAGGEEGLSIFNKTSIASQISYWQEDGTGYPLGVYVNRIVPILLVKLLLIFDFPLWGIQAFFYGTLIFVGLSFTYLVTKQILTKFRNVERIAMLAALFYLFNLYTQFQVISRFLYSSLALWTLIPLSLYFWIKFLNKGKLIYLFCFLSSSIIFSVAYLQPAHIITFWCPLVIWFIANKHKNFKYFSIAVLLWVIVNVWWLYPQLKLSSVSFSQTNDIKSNLDSLISVSQYYTNFSLLQLRQEFTFGPSNQYFQFYSQNLVKYISIAAMFLALYSLFKIIRVKKNFLAYLFVIGWFISKGSNPPLGISFYQFLFSHFSFLSVFRNSYEKFGLVLVFAYCILLAISIANLNRATRYVFVLLFCLVLLLPVWQGKTVQNKKISIPQSYDMANNWLNIEKTDGRIFEIPASPGDSVIYHWGYTGIVPSNYLFDRTSVSKILRAKYYDDIYLDTVNKYMEGKNIEQRLSDLGVGYVLVHKDISPYAKWVDDVSVTNLLNNQQYVLDLSTKDLDIYHKKRSFLFELLPTPNTPNQELSYKKFSNEHYQIYISNTMPESYLIFKTTFSPLWEARINNKLLTNHKIVYDYANSWQLPENYSGVVDIKFKVWPWD